MRKQLTNFRFRPELRLALRKLAERHSQTMTRQLEGLLEEAAIREGLLPKGWQEERRRAAA
jgi:hypothetical protein